MTRISTQVPLSHSLSAERLLLRLQSEAEIDFVWDATRHPGFNDGMLWDTPNDKEELRAPCLAAIESWKQGECYSFTYLLRSTEEPIGRIGLRNSSCGWSVGFWTHPKYQNYGYATEALRAVLRFAFQDLGVKSVEACHADWNLGSRRTLEKAGFRFRRHVEEGFQKNGEWVAEDVMSISLSQWQRIASGC